MIKAVAFDLDGTLIDSTDAIVTSFTHTFKVLGQRAPSREAIVGTIGLPLEEATYPNVSTTDGAPINAQNDYVIRMSKDELPPANAFWSLTLYDLQNGFFIPNDRKKYSVGENAGMQLNAEGGIDIYVAEKLPEGVPEENWLPISRKDENMDIILRIYVPDLEKLKTWETPRAEMLPK